MIPAMIGVLVAALVATGMVLTRHEQGHQPAVPLPPEDDGPLRILDEAFASGEIDLNEYQARRAQLRRAHRTGRAHRSR